MIFADLDSQHFYCHPVTEAELASMKHFTMFNTDVPTGGTEHNTSMATGPRSEWDRQLQKYDLIKMLNQTAPPVKGPLSLLYESAPDLKDIKAAVRDNIHHPFLLRNSDLMISDTLNRVHNMGHLNYRGIKEDNDLPSLEELLSCNKAT